MTRTEDKSHKSEKTRGEILSAAARLFRHDGFYATTMRDIAQETEIEAGSIYYHFASKDQILNEVLDIGVRQLFNEAREIARTARERNEGFRETFCRLVEAHLTFLLSDSDFTSANIRNYPMLSDETRGLHRELRASYGGVWTDFLQGGRDCGCLRKDVSVSVIRQFVLSAMNWTVEWYDVDRHPIKSIAVRLSKLILDGMCANVRLDETGLKTPTTLFPEASEPVGKAAKTRSEILRAAARVLRDTGYKATTLRRIAEEANVQAGSVYYHFESKDAIVDEVLNAGLSDLLSGVGMAVREFKPPYDHQSRIATAIWAHLQLLFMASEFTSANIRSYGMLPNHLRERHGEIRREYGRFWDRILGEAQRDGFIRADIKIVPLRQVMLGALNWTVEWFDSDRSGQEGYISLEEFSDMLIRLLLGGVCGKKTVSATNRDHTSRK